jgi:hypothetical protein
MIKEDKRTMWEILVPTIRSNGKPIKTKCHKNWDQKVRKITGGLTIFSPAKGQWISPAGDLFLERVIPVRILASEKEMNEIVDMTLLFYEQKAVLAYQLGDSYILKYSDENKDKNSLT